jgi:hypothetical protein
LISQWGFELRMKIPIVKIIDFNYNKEMQDKLERTDNPMAMVVNAQLKSYELKKAGNKKKSTVKWELIRQCYERGYTKKRIDALLKFIDWLIRLPDDLDKQLTKKVSKLEEEYKMPYVTSWERIAKKEGEEIGEERGVKIGEERGAKTNAKETARRMLADDFSIESIAKYTGLTEEEIKALLH